VISMFISFALSLALIGLSLLTNTSHV